MQSIVQSLYSAGVIPVVRIDQPDTAPALADALRTGGLPVIEITFRTRSAAQAIRCISQQDPSQLILAGTVLDIPTAQAAIDAGASAIVSPGTNMELVQWCQGQGIPIFPGCATASEIESCMRMGLSAVKLFPAEFLGGAKLVQALSAPYPAMRFMPTGGIDPMMLPQYLTLPSVLCCGGSWMVSEALLKAADFSQIEQLARQAARIVTDSRHGRKM